MVKPDQPWKKQSQAWLDNCNRTAVHNIDPIHNVSFPQTPPRRTSQLRTLTLTWALLRRRRQPSPFNRSSESSGRRSRWWNHNRAHAGRLWPRMGPMAPLGQGVACQIYSTVLGWGVMGWFGVRVGVGVDERWRGNLSFAIICQE